MYDSIDGIHDIPSNHSGDSALTKPGIHAVSVKLNDCIITFMNCGGARK